MNVVSNSTPNPRRVHKQVSVGGRTVCGLRGWAMRPQDRYDTTKPCAECFPELYVEAALRLQIKVLGNHSATMRKHRDALLEALEAERKNYKVAMRYVYVKPRARRRLHWLLKRLIE